MKIHIHAHEGGDHRFVPYWVTFTNTTVANGMFPPGNYRIWCPVYSFGQGFMQAGSGVGGNYGVYNVQLTGLSSVDSPSTEGDPTGTRYFLIIPLSLHAFQEFHVLFLEVVSD